MNMPRKYLVLLALMIAASIAAMVLRPTQRISDEGVKINLEAMIPKNLLAGH